MTGTLFGALAIVVVGVGLAMAVSSLALSGWISRSRGE